MSTRLRTFVIFATLAATASLAQADALTDALAAHRKARGQAIAKENQNFLRWLENALAQAKQQKLANEVTRIEALIEQVRAESAALQAEGDKHALLPTNTAQLRAYLVGSAWSVTKKASDSRVFTEDGQFKSKEGTVSYSIVSPRRVNTVWSSSMRIDCEFNEDFSAMKELGGRGSVWKRLP